MYKTCIEILSRQFHALSFYLLAMGRPLHWGPELTLSARPLISALSVTSASAYHKLYRESRAQPAEE